MPVSTDNSVSVGQPWIVWLATRPRVSGMTRSVTTPAVISIGLRPSRSLSQPNRTYIIIAGMALNSEVWNRSAAV